MSISGAADAAVAAAARGTDDNIFIRRKKTFGVNESFALWQQRQKCGDIPVFPGCFFFLINQNTLRVFIILW